MLRGRHELLRLNMKISVLDPELFFWKCDGKLAGIIFLHVDDFFWSGTPKFQQDVITHICRVFCVGNSENGTLKYVGLDIENGERSFLVHQIAYASTLSTVVMSRRRMQNKDALLTEDEKQKLDQLLVSCDESLPSLF